MSQALFFTILTCVNGSRLPLMNLLKQSWSGSGDLMSADLANFLLHHHYWSGDTSEEFPWEFPEFEQYKNDDFVFDYNGTPVIYAFWTAGHKENFQNYFNKQVSESQMMETKGVD